MSGRDIPGNAVGSQIEFERTLTRKASTILRLERVADRMFEQGDYIKSITIRLKGDGRAENLAIVRAQVAGEPVVCFHNADDVLETLAGVCARIENGSVKWKADEYAG